MLSSEAIIYLAENRECLQTETFRSLITIPNQNAETNSGLIVKISDNTLSPQKSYKLMAEENYCVVFLPLVGAIEIVNSGQDTLINSSEIGYFFVHKNEEILVQNPFETELVNYLEIWIKPSSIEVEGNFINYFNIESDKNSLVEISDLKLREKFFIGKFGGRKEGFLKGVESAFVFVINGVFEVNNRLLESRAGLELWNLTKIEFEGLGVENIILIITK